MRNENDTRVVVTDIRMPFWSMVAFMVKWAIAAIPAILILALLGALLSAAVTGWFSTTNHKIVRLESGAHTPIEAIARV